MAVEDDIAFLGRLPLFRQLGAAALRILAIGSESISIDAGEVLFVAGEDSDGAYIIQRGSFSLMPERAGDPEVIAGPGTLLGESALLAETRRPATATAREHSTVMRISRAMFLKVLESVPEAAERLRTMIASRSDQWAREIASIRARLTRGTES